MISELVGWVPAGAPRYSYWYQDGANALGAGTTITRFNGSSVATTPCNVTVAPASEGLAVAAAPSGLTAGAATWPVTTGSSMTSGTCRIRTAT